MWDHAIELNAMQKDVKREKKKRKRRKRRTENHKMEVKNTKTY